MRDADDRAAVELVHVHEFRIERKREGNVFAGGRLRAAQHHAGGPAADVAVDHFRVRGEAARREADAAPGEPFLLTFVGEGLHARHAEVVVVKELDHLVLVADFDAALLRGGEEVLHEAGAARDAVAQDAAGAAETRIGHRTDLAELDADILFQPVDAFGNVVRIGAVQSLVAHLLGDVHHHGVEGVGRILDALFLLVPRAPAADGAEGEDGVAVRTVALFKKHYLGAEIVRRNGGDQAGRACAHNDGIIDRGLRLACGLGFGSAGNAGGTGGGCAENGSLQEAAAGHIRARHHASPVFLLYMNAERTSDSPFGVSRKCRCAPPISMVASEQEKGLF